MATVEFIRADSGAGPFVFVYRALSVRDRKLRESGI